MMSGAEYLEKEGAAGMCCASCGIAEVDDVKLQKCNGCDLVRYCSDECKEDHRPEHQTKCKERAAELRDELLFRQPDSSYLGDCPICCVPFSIELTKGMLYPCCMKTVCIGCDYANIFTNLNNRDRADVSRVVKKMQNTACPFCRQPRSAKEKDFKKNVMKRMKKNDPEAFREMGTLRFQEGDCSGAVEYYRKAIELGDVDSHVRLVGCMYVEEENGVERDEEKEIYHWEEASIAGHPHGRYMLAFHEIRNKRLGRALKHYIIAANLGHDDSLQQLKMFYSLGMLKKEDFAAALRAHQAAVDATKSPQREAADKYYAELGVNESRK